MNIGNRGEKQEAETVVHSPALLETVKLLEGRGEIRPFFTYDFGRVKDSHGFSVVGTKEWAEEIWAFLRPQLPQGTITFLGTEYWLGEESPGEVELVLAEGEEPWDILRQARTDAINYGMNTEDLIRRLQSFYEEASFTLIQATSDIVEWRLDSWPQELAAYCEKIYELCPDIVDQGVGSVEILTEFVATTGRVWLWWD
ncbi:hypothetical protein JOD24_000676 [Kroppenstedtia sanguinis]|uniref:DUF4253 domain-containing protein n=1 Tax=Kroppenstedtia sanguinis TaxID=1380684 RepID=UPI003D1B0F0B